MSQDYFNFLREQVYILTGVGVYSQSTYDGTDLELPVILVERQASNSVHSMDGPAMRYETVTFFVRSNSVEQAEEIRDKIIALLDGLTVENNLKVSLVTSDDSFDFQTKVYERSIEFELCYRPDMAFTASGSIVTYVTHADSATNASNADNAISSSYAGNAGFALTASFAERVELPANLVSSSAQLSNSGGVAFNAANNVTLGQITASAITVLGTASLQPVNAIYFGDNSASLFRFSAGALQYQTNFGNPPSIRLRNGPNGGTSIFGRDSSDFTIIDSVSTNGFHLRHSGTTYMATIPARTTFNHELSGSVARFSSFVGNLTGSVQFSSILNAPTLVSSSAQISNGGGVALGTGNSITVGQITASAATLESAVVPSTSTEGIRLFNTANQTNNAETMHVLWEGNVATIKATRTGSGTQRNIAINAGTRTLTVAGLNSPHFTFNSSLSGNSGNYTQFTGTSNNSAGTVSFVAITPTYNGGGTNGATDLLINRTQSNIGSGVHRLIDAQVDGVSRFSVSNTGLTTTSQLRVTSSFTPSAANAAGDTGTIAWDGSYVYVCVAPNTWRRASLTTW